MMLHSHRATGCNQCVTPQHLSLDPEVARREQRAEITRRIEAALDALTALDALDALDARNQAPTRPAVERRLLTLDEAAGALSIGRTKLHGLLRSGALASVRIGTARRVRVEAIDAYLASLSDEVLAS